MKSLLLPFCALGLLIASCHDGGQPAVVDLRSYNDSLSYAAGVTYSKMLLSAAEDADASSCMDEFMAGVRDSYLYKITPESKAYVQGLSLGTTTVSLYEKAAAELLTGDGGLDAALFLEGMLAPLSGNHADVRFSLDFCNRNRYLPASEEFIARNSKRKSVKTLPSGLQYKIETMGQGNVAALGDKVRCIYKGAFPNGEVFDTSAGEEVLLSTYNVVPGLAEAFRTFPVGTRCTLYIPWQLGYGAFGKGEIPPYAVLVYELEIIEVIKK